MSSLIETGHTQGIIHDLTEGKPFIFFIESYTRPRKGIYEIVSKCVEETFHFKCIRADAVKSSGHDLLSKIHLLIERAIVVVADVTDPETNHPSPNVFYEVGYAVGVKKNPLLLVESTVKERPADVRGLEFIEYDRRKRNKDLPLQLVSHIRQRITSALPLLQDMLQGPDPEPAIIITSPKRPRDDFRIPQESPLIRTYGDRLGILGLIRSFGSMFGDSGSVELISSNHTASELLRHEANLYLIGSPKVNPPVGDILKDLQKGVLPRWSFEQRKAVPSAAGNEDEQELVLTCHSGRKKEQFRGRQEKPLNTNPVWVEDYGLVIRAGHPRCERKRLVFMLAGAHSLGTGAACLAVTCSRHIKEIRSRLLGKTTKDVLATKDKNIWVVVKGRIKAPGYHLFEDNVEVVDVGVFE